MGDLSKGQFGPFFIDVRERVLRRDGERVPLAPKAFDLLAALIEQAGRLVSKEQLLQTVWPDTFVEEANLAYNVFALRKALGDTAENGKYIETVPKRGYRFTATVTPVTSGPGEPPTADGTVEMERKTFSGESTLSRVPKVLSHEAPAPSWPITSVTPEGQRAILPFLHKGPSGRYQPMAAQTAPTEVLASESNGTTSIQTPVRSPWALPRWGLIALAPVLVAAYFAVDSWRGTPSPEPPRAVPLTALTGVVRAPSLSPDGSYVVFTWTGARQDNADLYVQQIGAGSPLRLTTDPANDYSPSWSPDGRTIAFLRRKPDGLETEVRLIAPLGGSERKLADIQPRVPSYRPHSVAWCPDSGCVLVTDSPGGGKPDAVFAILVNGGEKRQLTYPQGVVVDADPAISPDGGSLIFRRDTTPFSGQFYRVSLKGHIAPAGEPERLTSTLNAGRAVWMPDSREILFADRGWLWRLDARTGGAPTRLPFLGQDGLTPVVSRSADKQQRLVYVRSFADANVWRVDTAAAGTPASSPPLAAIVSTRSDHLPNLSPDGRRVVFSSSRSGETEFWLADPDGSNAVQLTSMGILPGFPRWSPDGKLIVFHGDPEGRPDVLLVPAAGGTPKIMTSTMPNGGFPSVSRDGQWIYFTVVQNGEARIWKIPASGGAAAQITSTAGTLAIESRDGRDLYYVEAANRSSSLWRLPLGGGAPAKVLDGVVLGNFDVVEGGIYYVDRVPDEAGAVVSGQRPGDGRLQYFDFSTRQSTTVAHNLGSVGFGLSASADGRTIFYSRIDSSVDELMLVDNFR